jgi:hypothetical protein
MFRRLAGSLGSLTAIVLALGGCAGAPTAAEAQGHTTLRDTSDTSSNDQVAFDFFLGKGLTAVQAAGIVGNLDQESGMDPGISQLGGGPGRGIAQWSAGGRWDSDPINCSDYAAQQGEDVDSLQLQLEFIWYELNQEPNLGIADLQAADTLEDAVTTFQNEYEGCGACDQGKRVDFAQTALDAFGADTPPPDTDGAGSATGDPPQTDPGGGVTHGPSQTGPAGGGKPVRPWPH